jgi:GNAT superfamily N-acetyltransferase
MPIELRRISQPNEQELKDLIAIYEDGENMPEGLGAWIERRLKHGNSLFAGYFNGKFIAAIWAIHTVNTWTLEDLCVREFTRRRGVARQLLTLLIQQADKDRIDLQIPGGKVPEFLHPFLSELGFHSVASPCAGPLWARGFKRINT